MIMNPVIQGGGVETVTGTLRMNSPRDELYCNYSDGAAGKTVSCSSTQAITITVLKNSLVEIIGSGDGENGHELSVSGNATKLSQYSELYYVSGDFSADVS